MSSPHRLYAPLVALALVLSMLMLSAPATSFAANPSLTASGTSTAPCGAGGRPAPAVVQGQPFQVSFNNFPATAIVVTFTFPDGRIYSPTAASPNIPSLTPKIDGISDLIVGAPYIVSADGANDPFESFETSGAWLPGCYTITATTAAFLTPTTVSTQVAVLAPPLQFQPGGTTLVVQAASTNQASGPQGSIINIIGRNIATGSTVALQLIQPNGTRINLPPPPPPAPPAEHGFTSPYAFTPAHRTGRYTVVATITMPNGEALTNMAQFTLTPAIPPARGNALLSVLSPINRLVPQAGAVNMQGTRFTPGPVNLFLVLPGGAILTENELPTLAGYAAIANGGIPGGITLPMSPALPTGAYTLIATYGPAGTPASTSTTWQVTP